MYTPFNHNFIINLAIVNKVQKCLTFMGKKSIKCAYLNFGGQELIKINFPDLRPKFYFFSIILPDSDSSSNSI